MYHHRKQWALSVSPKLAGLFDSRILLNQPFSMDERLKTNSGENKQHFHIFLLIVHEISCQSKDSNA